MPLAFWVSRITLILSLAAYGALIVVFMFAVVANAVLQNTRIPVCMQRHHGYLSSCIKLGYPFMQIGS